MKKTTKEDLIDAALAVAALLAVVAAPIANAILKDDKPLLALAATNGSILLSFAIAFVVVLRRKNAKYERRVQKLSADHERKVRKLIEDHEHTLTAVRLMDVAKNSEIYSIEEALSYVGDNAKNNKIRLIMNTSFCTQQSKNDIELRLTNQPWYVEYCENVLQPLENSTMKFMDLLSPAVASMESHRHKEFVRRIKNENIYEPRVYPLDQAPMEFTLLEFADGRREVLLGWNYAAVTGKPVVLRLPQSHIFEIFEQHFKELWNIKISKPLSSYKASRKTIFDQFVRAQDSKKVKRRSKVKE